VVGQWGTSNIPQHAFLYSNGTMTGLPEPSFTGGAGCVADAINNAGQIAGSCWDTSGTAHLVLWQNGTVTDLGTLGTPGNYTFTQAVSINNNGQIAGTVFTTGVGVSEGFLYSNGTITSLGSFLPASINDNGVMVGGPSIDSGGSVQNLNTLIPAGSPYQIQDATAINDKGQIVANTTNNHALLLTPGCPPPPLRALVSPGVTPEWSICALLAIPATGEPAARNRQGGCAAIARDKHPADTHHP
jgi:probable HAF family extracellular repeat protein